MQHTLMTEPFYVQRYDEPKHMKELDFLKQWITEVAGQGPAFPGVVVPKPRLSTNIWQADLGSAWPRDATWLKYGSGIATDVSSKPSRPSGWVNR